MLRGMGKCRCCSHLSSVDQRSHPCCWLSGRVGTDDKVTIVTQRVEEIRDKHTSVGRLEIGPINWFDGLTDDAPVARVTRRRKEAEQTAAAALLLQCGATLFT
jgi:hypothetical protein